MSIILPSNKVIKSTYDLEEEYYKRFLDYTPNPKQEAFHVAGLTAQERWVGGGNRSGKTHGMLREDAMHLTGRYPEYWKGYRFNIPIRCWIAGKTASLMAETLQKDIIGDTEQNLRGILHPSWIKEKRKSGNSDMYRTIYVKHVSGGASKITFKTYEEGREAFQAGKIHLAHLDEEPPFNIYQECKMRTMSTDPNTRGMIMVSSTSLKGRSEFVNYFRRDRHPEEVRDSRWHCFIRWEDTLHLVKEEKDRMIAGMSPHEIEARTNGIEWAGSGLVYPVQESTIICNPFEIPDYWPRAYAIDFGWNHPAFLFMAHDRDNDVIYLYAEYSVPKRTPDGHAEALQTFGIDWIPAVYDPSGRGSQTGDGKKPIDLYISAGFKNLYPANNSKEEGILKTLQRMYSGQLKIFSTLVKTRAELGSYLRDESGIPYKVDDHFMDCMRYLVMSGVQVAIPKNFASKDYEGMYYDDEPGYF